MKTTSPKKSVENKIILRNIILNTFLFYYK